MRLALNRAALAIKEEFHSDDFKLSPSMLDTMPSNYHPMFTLDAIFNIEQIKYGITL